MIFHEKIGEEVLPKREHSYLVGVNHPGFFNSLKEITLMKETNRL
jgi:hypothetical protein